MPINKSKVKQPHSYSEKYYWNQFTEKHIELFKQLERNPNDLVAKKQFQFVDRVLREGEKNDNFNWTNAWQS